MNTHDHTCRPFRKMHGLGNDFVLFDARETPLALDNGTVRALADRRFGIGCDQLIIMRQSDKADIFMEIRNADGGDVGACGNATRCVGRLLIEETGTSRVTIETRAGLLAAEQAKDGIRVDMGRPSFDWRAIPLARETETDRLDIALADCDTPAAVSMGNPHLVFFVSDLEQVNAASAGAGLEHHPLFPEGVNVSFVKVKAPDHLQVATWERGAGLTQACGTAACASLVSAHRRGLAAREGHVDMPGGRLWIAWGADDHVRMTGPVAHAFDGVVSLAAYGARS